MASKFSPDAPDSLSPKERESTCLELALEGERLCKAGDCELGIQFFEAAVRIGTEDLKTLSAIYSQLGNAYFYVQNYGQALEYHKRDLHLARRMRDKSGEAKASGNLGNTLKVLGKFEEALACCEHHLMIAKETKDKLSECRALYNLGNVCHAMGKYSGRSQHHHQKKPLEMKRNIKDEQESNQERHDPLDMPQEIREILEKAIHFYQENLSMVRELNDRAAEGRVCGNLGNTHYLLGNFQQAIRYHRERLSIAKEFGDKVAERRAYSNLGNAHIFLAEFETAADNYMRSLQIARSLGDRALEAQACYSLGNTHTLMQDYGRAVEFHLHHMRIAQELGDRVGESRACWSLGNAYMSLNNCERALQYVENHLSLSKELSDESGKSTAEFNIAQLKEKIANASPKSVVKDQPEDSVELNNMKQFEDKNFSDAKIEGATANLSMIVNDSSANDSSRCSLSLDSSELVDADEENFFALISKYQSRRMDEQRCSFDVNESSENATNGHLSPAQNAFLDQLAGLQGARMNDQRAVLPPAVVQHEQAAVSVVHKETQLLDDSFFEMLMRCQATRIDDQRSSLPDPLFRPPAPTVPDEDFFSLIQRVQSNRFEEQRSKPPPPLPSPSSESQQLPSVFTKIVKRGSSKKKKK